MTRKVAFAAVADGSAWRIAIVDADEPGYIFDPREPVFASETVALVRAQLCNEQLGLTPTQAWQVVAASIQKALAAKKPWSPR